MGSFEARYQTGEYLQRSGDWHEQDAVWKATHVLDLLREAGIGGHRIADIGCGTGGVLVQLQPMLPRGTELTGFEIAEPAFRIAEHRGNAHLRFVNGSAGDWEGDPFDVALALDVFEHVPDYLGFLASMRSIAKTFVFHIPLDISLRSILTELPMHRRRTVGHLHYFTASTARATLEESGFRILTDKYTHAVLQPPPSSWKWRLRLLPDRMMFRFNEGLCATMLGGCSLLVLAQPSEDHRSTIYQA